MLISNTIVSDLSNSTDRVKYLGYVNSAGSIGFIFGPLLGGTLSELFGKLVPVYVSCCIYLFDLFLVIFIMKEPSKIHLELTENIDQSDSLENKNETVDENINESTPSLSKQLCDFKNMTKMIWESYTLLYLLFIQFIITTVSKITCNFFINLITNQ